MTCERCYQPLDHGDHGLYLCPLQTRRDAPVVWADDIPGGIEIAHGLCNADGTPRRFDSRSAIRRAAAEKGLAQWSDGYTEDRLKDAHVHNDWLKSGESQRLRAERVEMRRAGRPDLARQQQRPR